ncbi:Calmodulin-1 [Diplonema papillatum]|nr:Calmodulin-1 [Diplonema papillatum]
MDPRSKEPRGREDTRVGEIFELIDSDGSGFVSVDEVVAFNQCLPRPIAHGDLVSFFKEADADYNNLIDRAEFRQLVSKMEQSVGLQTPEMVRLFSNSCYQKLFLLVDGDEGGTISGDELLRLVTLLSSRLRLAVTDDDIRRMKRELCLEDSAITPEKFADLISTVANDVPVSQVLHAFSAAHEDSQSRAVQAFSAFFQSGGAAPFLSKRARKCTSPNLSVTSPVLPSSNTCSPALIAADLVSRKAYDDSINSATQSSFPQGTLFKSSLPPPHVVQVSPLSNAPPPIAQPRAPPPPQPSASQNRGSFPTPPPPADISPTLRPPDPPVAPKDLPTLHSSPAPKAPPPPPSLPDGRQPACLVATALPTAALDDPIGIASPRTPSTEADEEDFLKSIATPRGNPSTRFERRSPGASVEAELLFTQVESPKSSETAGTPPHRRTAELVVDQAFVGGRHPRTDATDPGTTAIRPLLSPTGACMPVRGEPLAAGPRSDLLPPPISPRLPLSPQVSAVLHIHPMPRLSGGDAVGRVTQWLTELMSEYGEVKGVLVSLEAGFGRVVLGTAKQASDVVMFAEGGVLDSFGKTQKLTVRLLSEAGRHATGSFEEIDEPALQHTQTPGRISHGSLSLSPYGRGEPRHEEVRPVRMREPYDLMFLPSTSMLRHTKENASLISGMQRAASDITSPLCRQVAVEGHDRLTSSSIFSAEERRTARLHTQYTDKLPPQDKPAACDSDLVGLKMLAETHSQKQPSIGLDLLISSSQAARHDVMRSWSEVLVAHSEPSSPMTLHYDSPRLTRREPVDEADHNKLLSQESPRALLERKKCIKEELRSIGLPDDLKHRLHGELHRIYDELSKVYAESVLEDHPRSDRVKANISSLSAKRQEEKLSLQRRLHQPQPDNIFSHLRLQRTVSKRLHETDAMSPQPFVTDFAIPEVETAMDTRQEEATTFVPLVSQPAPPRLPAKARRRFKAVDADDFSVERFAQAANKTVPAARRPCHIKGDAAIRACSLHAHAVDVKKPPPALRSDAAQLERALQLLPKAGEIIVPHGSPLQSMSETRYLEMVASPSRARGAHEEQVELTESMIQRRVNYYNAVAARAEKSATTAPGGAASPFLTVPHAGGSPAAAAVALDSDEDRRSLPPQYAPSAPEILPPPLYDEVHRVDPSEEGYLHASIPYDSATATIDWERVRLLEDEIANQSRILHKLASIPGVAEVSNRVCPGESPAGVGAGGGGSSEEDLLQMTRIVLQNQSREEARLHEAQRLEQEVQDLHDRRLRYVYQSRS